ncbi:hypothetical protein KO528_01360 [Saccharophagus degradans]|uniref:hypothetical protein n=1 Tax=Saccharophagus degradans TaxID=86304 RepID=UPI001C083130|nr:hypothetical protein [Saccharophagus degradans]MBU2983985.1 hypothetical protein [Saccharophagus degradans]
MTYCPHCNKKMKILDVLGMNNWAPTICGYCNKGCMATDRSLAVWLFALVVVVGSIIFVASPFMERGKVFSGVVVIFVWVITFPLIVKAKKYKARQYWLPKSRILACFVYLVIPVCVVVLAFILAIYFKVGM